MKKLFIVALIALLLVPAAFAQVTAAGAATTAVGAASTVASSDMGPGLESLKSDVNEGYTIVSGDTLKGISAARFGDYRYWPVVYMTNKESIANPERIEPATALRIYRLPFNAASPSDISKLLIVETYLQTYARYVELGADWVGARRWVLLEATHFSPELFSKFASRIEDSDEAWYKAR
ncbi:MAG: hypothetical protein CVV47_14355 [Spirochaetae bacterium HGW-Spirochaetae-3]|jgi:hypothetical protein|nr:MAG: hypothetical protein CVV47_14355 [Spirochaetae bacterium HGW-Spirochaetae-3]